MWQSQVILISIEPQRRTPDNHRISNSFQSHVSCYCLDTMTCDLPTYRREQVPPLQTQYGFVYSLSCPTYKVGDKGMRGLRSFIATYPGILYLTALRYLAQDPCTCWPISRGKLDYYYLLPFVGAAAWPGFGLLAPYFERPRRRLETPSLSSVPRTI